MSYCLLDSDIWFPHPRYASDDGLVAIGGDLKLERLLLAYQHGIFPWYCEGEPILWFSPDPRFVLLPQNLKVRRSLRKALKNSRFKIRYDSAFAQVIEHCAHQTRAGTDGTWITNEMSQAYNELHRLGFAHSVETWRDDRLVGGLYGVALGPFFFGESMFHLESNASKAALIALVNRYPNAPFIDCQVYNSFFESMGAGHIERDKFLEALANRIHETNHWKATLSAYPEQSIDEVLHDQEKRAQISA